MGQSSGRMLTDWIQSDKALAQLSEDDQLSLLGSSSELLLAPVFEVLVLSEDVGQESGRYPHSSGASTHNSVLSERCMSIAGRK